MSLPRVWPTYPAALGDDPPGKAIFEVAQWQLLYLPRNGRTHSGQLNCRLCEAEHDGDLLPARFRHPDALINDLFEGSVARALDQSPRERVDELNKAEIFT